MNLGRFISGFGDPNVNYNILGQLIHEPHGYSGTAILQPPQPVEVPDSSKGDCFTITTQEDKCFSVSVVEEDCFKISAVEEDEIPFKDFDLERFGIYNSIDIHVQSINSMFVLGHLKDNITQEIYPALIDVLITTDIESGSIKNMHGIYRSADLRDYNFPTIIPNTIRIAGYACEGLSDIAIYNTTDSNIYIFEVVLLSKTNNFELPCSSYYWMDESHIGIQTVDFVAGFWGAGFSRDSEQLICSGKPQCENSPNIQNYYGTQPTVYGYNVSTGLRVEVFGAEGGIKLDESNSVIDDVVVYQRGDMVLSNYDAKSSLWKNVGTPHGTPYSIRKDQSLYNCCLQNHFNYYPSWFEGEFQIDINSGTGVVGSDFTKVEYYNDLIGVEKEESASIYDIPSSTRVGVTDKRFSFMVSQFNIIVTLEGSSTIKQQPVTEMEEPAP